MLAFPRTGTLALCVVTMIWPLFFLFNIDDIKVSTINALSIWSSGWSITKIVSLCCKIIGRITVHLCPVESSLKSFHSVPSLRLKVILSSSKTVAISYIESFRLLIILEALSFEIEIKEIKSSILSFSIMFISSLGGIVSEITDTISLYFIPVPFSAFVNTWL